MRATKTAIAAALRSDNNVTKLVPREQIYAVERATLPTLPAVEVIALSSERVDTGPMLRHELSCEITVASATEDGADELLDGIVRAVRARLRDAEHSTRPMPWRAVRAVCACWAGRAGQSARPIRQA